MREHLGDPGLDAETIAAAHHVSVRQLYKTCAKADLRLEQWIIDERLANAAEDLARSRRERTIVPWPQLGVRQRLALRDPLPAGVRRLAGDWQAINQEK